MAAYMGLEMAETWRIYRFICVLICLLIPSATCERSLKLAHVLYRHGDRSPAGSFPTDNYTEDTWPQGFGQLTEGGMKQQYELGQWLRQRYVDQEHLLDGPYKVKESFVRSSAFERTIISAQSNLQGLFPMEGGGTYNGTPPWQPVPVFSVEKEQDFMLTMRHTSCEAAQEFEETHWNSESMQQYIKNDQAFFDRVKSYAGYDEEIFFFNYSYVGDTLLREKIEGRLLPAWVDDDTFDKLRATNDFWFEAYYYNMTTEAKQLFAGVLLTDIVTHIKDHISGADNDSKLFIYSGHDTDVAPFLGMFDLFNNIAPPTASCILLELYKEESGVYTVELLYRNDTTRTPYLLTLPSCAMQCPVETFYAVSAPYLVDSIEELCRSKPSAMIWTIEWNLGWFLAATSLCIAALLPLIVCVVLVVGVGGRRRLQSAKKRMEPINFHLLGGPNSESEDESVFDT